MADLSIINTTLSLMDEALVQEKEENKHISTTLGMGSIGDSCTRKLWLNYHTDFQHEPPTAKGYRIFDMGDYIETRVVRDLRRVKGFKVDRNKKRNCYLALDGRFKGYSDGKVWGIPESKVKHILEIKSCNNKNFKIFKKEGIAGHKIYGDKYIFQVQCYMKYSGLRRTMFIIENKDNSDQHMERINYDVNIACKAEAKAIAIIEAKTPPSPIGDESWYLCRWCSHNNAFSCRKDWGTEW